MTSTLKGAPDTPWHIWKDSDGYGPYISNVRDELVLYVADDKYELAERIIVAVNKLAAAEAEVERLTIIIRAAAVRANTSLPLFQDDPYERGRRSEREAFQAILAALTATPPAEERSK